MERTMYRIPLANIMMHLGKSASKSSTGRYSWSCGCIARPDAKCVGNQLKWSMCAYHFSKE